MNPFKHIAHAVLTDVGNKRKNNEDAYAVAPEHGFFCVADGMGGAEDGEVASGAVVERLNALFGGETSEIPEKGAAGRPSLPGCFDPERPFSIRAKTAWIDSSLSDISSWIYSRSKERGKSGSGTTFVGVTFDPAAPSSAVALHAGDSRVYHWCARESRLSLVTLDHSVANAVGISDERQLNPAFRNMLMRAVGLGPSVQVEHTLFQVAPGDWIAVCSDGLSKMIEDAEIGSMLSSTPDPDAAVRALVDAALKAGGKDNVTVVVVLVGELPEPVAEADLNTEMPALVASGPTDTQTPTADTGTGTTPDAQEEGRGGSLPPFREYVPRRGLQFRGIWLVIWALCFLLAVLIFAGVANLLVPEKAPEPTTTLPPDVRDSPEYERLRLQAEKWGSGE